MTRPLPDWMIFKKDLPPNERVERLMRWFAECSRSMSESRAHAVAEAKQRFEGLRDAIDAAIADGVTLREIAASLGLSARQVRRLLEA